jgi:integrase
MGTKLPKNPRERMEPLSVDAVRALTDAMPDRYRALVSLAAGTGLRQGEAFGLGPTGSTSSAASSPSIGS